MPDKAGVGVKVVVSLSSVVERAAVDADVVEVDAVVDVSSSISVVVDIAVVVRSARAPNTSHLSVLGMRKLSIGLFPSEKVEQKRKKRH